jgi:hypothetical protein
MEKRFVYSSLVSLSIIAVDGYPNMSENDESRRLLQEEIMGVIPAITFSEGAPLHCGLVFATKVLIVAFMTRFREIWWATQTPRYYALKRDWAQYEHKPTSSILKNTHYKNYIIPYSNITHVGATETGKVRKRSTLVVYTTEGTYTFKCVTNLQTVEKDVSQLLRQAGVRFSKGE